MHSLLTAHQSSKSTTNRIALSTVSKHGFRFSVVACAVSLLWGCASTPYEPSNVEIRDIATDQSSLPPADGESTPYGESPELVVDAVGEDQYAKQASRAEYYRQQAQSQQNSDARVDSTLSSAEYFIQANDHRRAAELVDSVRPLIHNIKQQDRANVILAYADYAEGNCSIALARLDGLLHSPTELPLEPETASPSTQTPSEPIANDRRYIEDDLALTPKEQLSTQQVDALLLSSFCHQQMGDHEAQIAALIRRESALHGAARAETTRYIWQVINAMPVEQRQSILDYSQDMQVRNRIEQSLSGEIGLVEQQPQQFNKWRDDQLTTVQTSIVDNNWDINSPRSVYVLLPLSSRYAKAAQAVKDGIDSEHSANQSPYRPTLSYYDIGDNPLQVGQYYAAAIRAGADFIIGPLGRDYSNEASTSSAYFTNSGYQAPAPMLMLGGDQRLNSGNMRFSMSPEMEGRQVAERAWKEGHLSAGVLVSNDAKGQRALNGFSDRWLSLGGKLSKTIQYSAQQYDHSVELKQLFDINQSEYRYRRISQVLGFKPEFSAYQRGDIDFVFMVADDKTGRIVRPQINFFTNSQLPVYATSSIYNGIEDSINNVDLDNTRFPVMPWVVRSSNVGQYAGQLNMLFAMGMDSYRIAGSNHKLKRAQENAIQGETGQLQLLANGDVIYEPVWATFSEGNLQVIDSKGLNVTPLEGSNEPIEQGSSNYQQNSKGSYNDDNWDTGKSRRKTGS